MTHCPETQSPAPEGRQHHCVGDKGHNGPHWCLLGHTWTNDESESA